MLFSGATPVRHMAYVKTKTLVRARLFRRKLTNAETILWSQLRSGIGGMRFRRQYPIGPYIADFACLRTRLVIEVDGPTHSSDDEQIYDARREAYLRSQSWRVFRITNDAIYDCLDRVLDAIYERSRTGT